MKGRPGGCFGTGCGSMGVSGDGLWVRGEVFRPEYMGGFEAVSPSL